jgi:predicted SprT family Zn-dependent metalloprotease
MTEENFYAEMPEDQNFAAEKTKFVSYFPGNALEEVMKMIKKYHIHVKITRSRKSRLGTYIYPQRCNYHTITINGNLNEYEFLEVFLHEYAHLLAHINHGDSIKPHGIEWKNCCREVYRHFIRKNLFPLDVCSALEKLTIKMPATQTPEMVNIFRKYGERKSFATQRYFCCNW